MPACTGAHKNEMKLYFHKFDGCVSCGCICQVPLGLVLVWTYAFLLTESKVYTYKGCSVNLVKNITAVIPPACTKHVATMRSCRTDTSDALSSAAWFWFPHPFQWGHPTFHWQTAIVMIIASIVASVDSVSRASAQPQYVGLWINNMRNI